jgi:hemolysin activation/secretion protein
VVQFGQDYVRREPGGAWALRSQFNLGTNWFDATENDGDIPDGQFISWLGQVQRVQQLGEDHLLVVRGDVQLAPDGLLPNQQFLIGGGRSLRGYRQNVRAGDNGFRLSIEDRITVGRDAAGLETFQLIPFADIGTVWNAGDNPNDLPDQTFLAGVGLGLWWEVVPGWEVRLDYGLPLVDLDDRGDNIQDDGFYFSVSYGFGR